MYLQFKTFRLLNTYSVNNGWTAPSFARRKQWDSVVADFVVKSKDHVKPLVYVGDLNCSPTGVETRECDSCHGDQEVSLLSMHWACRCHALCGIGLVTRAPRGQQTAMGPPSLQITT